MRRLLRPQHTFTAPVLPNGWGLGYGGRQAYLPSVLCLHPNSTQCMLLSCGQRHAAPYPHSPFSILHLKRLGKRLPERVGSVYRRLTSSCAYDDAGSITQRPALTDYTPHIRAGLVPPDFRCHWLGERHPSGDGERCTHPEPPRLPIEARESLSHTDP